MPASFFLARQLVHYQCFPLFLWNAVDEGDLSAAWLLVSKDRVIIYYFCKILNEMVILG